MIGIIKVLASLLAIASFCVLICESTSRGDLEKINKKLVAALPESTDYEENFKVIRKLLEEKSKEGCTFWTKSYSNTLKKLVFLETVRCDDEHHDTLKAINAAFGDDGHKRDSLNRIGELVYQLTSMYRDDCQNIAFKIFESKQQLDLKAALESINKNLVETVPNTELGSNLDALKQMLDAESKKADGANKVYTNTLEDLISLDSSDCSKKIHKSLLRINVALNNEARMSNIPVRRISRILYELSTKHAKKCVDTYNDIFESKVTQLDPQRVQYVEKFYKNMEDYDHHWAFHAADWIKDFRFFKLQKMFDELLYGTPIAWREYRAYVIQALEDFTEGTDDSKYLTKIPNEIDGTKKIDVKNLKRVFDKYLVEPCRYYSDELGPEVYEPAFYDAEWHREVDESKPKFYEGWARFKLCAQLRANEPKAFRDMLELLETRNFHK